MKKIKKLLMLIPACGLFLSGCSFEDIKNSVTGLFSGKKEEEKSEQPADSKPADSTPSGGDTTPASTVSFEDMELRIKPIAAALLGKEESALVSEDYDEADEDSTADYFTYNKGDLMFVDLPYESSNEGATYEDLFNELKAQLPSSASEVEDKCTHDETNYYYDYVYKVDDYYYCLYACDFYGLGMAIYGSFDIVPASQYAAYYAKMYDSEGSGGDDDTEITALKIMQDVGTYGWGNFEEGDFTDPDSDGIVKSNYSIQLSNVENPEDSDECLSGVLTSFVSDEDFPSYLSVVEGPTYTANAIEDSIGVSSIFLSTSDDAFTLYMYDYVDEDSVVIVFMAGPTSAFTE